MDDQAEIGSLMDIFREEAMQTYPRRVCVERQGALWVSLPGEPACMTAELMQMQQDAALPMYLAACGPGLCGEVFGYGDQLPMADLLGRAFRHGGHDCWSLCRDYYRQRGLLLADYPRDWKWWLTDSIIHEGAMKDFDRVDEERLEEGDLLGWCFLPGERPTHTSVYLGDDKLLHHTTWRGRYYDPASLSEILQLEGFPARPHSRWRPRQ